MSLKRISVDEFYPYHEFTDDEWERFIDVPDVIVTRCEQAMEEFRACQKILRDYWKAAKEKPAVVTEQAEPGNSQ